MIGSIKKIFFLIIFTLTALSLQGCNLLGESNVEIAPYKILQKEEAFELRHYDELILVSKRMENMEDSRSPFKKLFGYISGKNKSNKEINMTAPVFLDQKNNSTETMSFVLPKNFSIETAPLPSDPSVKLEPLRNYIVATIRFNGRLTQENIGDHKVKLNKWIRDKGFTVTGPAKAAGYNPPFTIPHYRRNEIMIPVEMPQN